MENGIRPPEAAPQERDSFADQTRKASYEVANQNVGDDFYRVRNLVEITSTLSAGGLGLEISPRDLLQQTIQLSVDDRRHYTPETYIKLEAQARAVAGDLSGARERTAQFARHPEARRDTYDTIHLHLANARLAAKQGEDFSSDIHKAWRISGQDSTLASLQGRQIAEAAFDLGADSKQFFDVLIENALKKATRGGLHMDHLPELAASLARCGYLDEAVGLMSRYKRPQRSSNIPMEESIIVARNLIEAGRTDDALAISEASSERFVKIMIALEIAKSSAFDPDRMQSIRDLSLALQPTRWGLGYDSRVYAEYCLLTRTDPVADTPLHIVNEINGDGFKIEEAATEACANFGRVQGKLGLPSDRVFDRAFQFADKIVPQGRHSNMDVFEYYNGLIDIADNSASANNQAVFERAMSEVKKIGTNKDFHLHRVGMDLDREFVVSETAHRLAGVAVDLSKAA